MSGEKKFIWDELDGEAEHPPSRGASRAERRARGAAPVRGGAAGDAASGGASSSARYVWDEALDDDATTPAPAPRAGARAGDAETFEAVQRQLNHAREDRAAEVAAVKAEWDAKLEAQRVEHAAALKKQEDLKATLKDDVAKLERRRRDLRSMAEWKAAEQKELEAVVEKRRAGIKAKVIKALEPEVHRLISANRDDLAKKERELEEELERERRTILAEHEIVLRQEQQKADAQMEQQLSDLREENTKKLKAKQEAHDADLRKLWDEHKAALEAERKAHEVECDRLKQRRQVEEAELKREEHIKTAELVVEHERHLQLDREKVEAEEREAQAAYERERAAYQAKFLAEQEAAKPAKIDKLADAQRERDAFSAKLEAKTADLEAKHADAITKMKEQNAAAMAQYMAVAAEEAKLRDECETVNRNTARLVAETEALEQEVAESSGKKADMTRQHELKVEALDKQFEKLKRDKEAKIRKAHADFAALVEKEKEMAKQHTHERRCQLDAQHQELERIDAKIDAARRKKLKRRRSCSRSDSDDSDDEDAAERRALAESRAGGGARAQLASARATAASDRAGLERAAKTILPGGAPWLETLVLTAPEPLSAATDDDLEREVAFYNMALGLVREGRDKLRALGEPYKRPKDFFCEMTKSDGHMAKVKENLLFQQKKMDAFEQRKRRQAEVKYAKALQAEKEAKQRGRRADGDGDDGPPRPGKSGKQKNKDKKWGYGGVQKGKKKSDAVHRRHEEFQPQRQGRGKRKGGGARAAAPEAA
ncbi:hypothetical protein JL721_5387 [Aureococcus anophagefferens]|nr:hypothetical protein JL721_5387 [Aureococcus anophagefferens]